MRYWIETTSGQQSLLSGKSIEEERTNEASSEQKAGKLLAGPVFTYFQQQLNSAVLYLGYFSYSTCYLVNLWTIITISSSKNIFFWLASWYINLSQINHLLFKLRYRCFPDSAGSSSPFYKHLVCQMLNLKHRSALKSGILKQLLSFCWSSSSGGQSYVWLQSYK